MLPALAGFATKALLPSKKKIDKNKLLNRKESSAIQKVDKEKGATAAPVIKRKKISTDLLLPQPEIKALPPATEVRKDVKGGRLDGIFNRIGKTLKGIIDTLKNRNQVQDQENKNKKQEAKLDEKKKREEKLEGDSKKKPFRMPSINAPEDKFNLMRFFGNILLGSLALAIFKNLEQIIETLKNVFQTIKDFITKLGEFFSPVWNGLKWIVGKGTELVGKLLGIPSENLSDKDILKNLNEIKDSIPFLKNLFEGINNTINSIRGSSGAGPVGGAGSPTASGDLFQLISGAEGGVNSVNRGIAGDTPGGARSIFGKDLTDMTVDEIYAAQKAGKVSAVGKYQIIKKTMPGFINYLRARRIDTSRTKFTEDIQDKFRDYVVDFKRPEVGKYIRGESSNREEAVQELAREFASIGLSYAEAGRSRGESRYSGTAGNRASISPEAVAAALDQSRSSGGIAAPTPTPTPTTGSSTTPTPAQVSTDVESSATSLSMSQSLSSLSPAEVSRTQAPSNAAESIPQIMQQAEYEVSYQERKTMILPIPTGGQSASSSNMTGGSSIIPIGLSKKEALNSYYQAQLIGFLYKQG